MTFEVQFQLDDKSFTLNDTSAAAAEAAAERAEAAAASFVTDTTLTHTGQAADSKKVGDEIQSIRQDMGSLSNLETTAKNNLVAAINEAMESGGGLDLADLTMAAAVSQTAGYSTLTLSDDQGTSKSVDIPVNTLSNQDTEYIDNLVQEYLQTLVVDGDEGEY